MASHSTEHLDGKIFMKVLGVKVDDIHNWSPVPKATSNHLDILREEGSMTIHSTSKPLMSSEDMVGQRTDKGYLVNVNDELIALFKVQGKLYAVKDSCPHAGGPLCMGDIEELPGEGLCVRCPWHQWKILLDSGNIGEHKGRNQSAVIYPVKVNSEGDIYIGFDQVSQTFFNIDKHPIVDKVAGLKIGTGGKRVWKKSLTM